MRELLDFLKEKNFPPILPDFQSVQRFRRGDSQKENGWILGRKKDDFVVIKFGDWKTGEEYSWQAFLNNSNNLNLDTQKLATELEEEVRLAREKRQEQVAQEWQARWPNQISYGYTPYMQRKRINSLGNAKISADYPDTLLIPAYDLENKLWGSQRIFANGEKRFASGMKIKGCFFLFGSITHQEGEVIYVCEGYATGASIFAATGRPTAVAFNAGNLEAVARNFHEKFLASKIIIAGDNDAYTDANPGKEKAEIAALAASGSFCLPDFSDCNVSSKPTDFNDLHLLRGLEVVKQQLDIKLLQKSPENTPKNAQKAPKKPPRNEFKIASQVLDQFGENIIRQKNDLFLYTGKKWQFMDELDHDKLKNTINAICGNGLPSKDVNSIYKTLLRYIPSVPRGTNLFVPNPTCANFQDGTLHLKRDIAQSIYSVEFLPHNKTDFVTWMIPIDYLGDRKAQNSLFIQLLDESFLDDPHKDGKISSLKQMAGAMLLPAFSQLFFLHGVSGSRKSTIVKTLLKVLTTENVSFLDPGHMEGFHLAAMLGKLVNANTDIADDIRLPRGFMKRFEDNLPFPVNRKGKDVVYAALPAVQIFCANKLPPNFEGSSRALSRRVTLIEFLRDLTNGPGVKNIKFYEDIIFQAGARGILNFMLDGLDELLRAGGIFKPPVSGGEKLDEWQRASDPIGQFLHECQSGQVVEGNCRVTVGGKYKIERQVAWKVFLVWHQATYSRDPWVTRFGFYASLRERGYQEKKTEWERHFLGIGLEPFEGAKT